MSGPIQPEVDGEFYIDNDKSDFYLRENAAWGKKGRLFRTNIVGFYVSGRFVGGEQYELASSASPVTYDTVFSPMHSSVRAEYPPVADVTLVFTDDLAAYLAYGGRAICTAHIAANTQNATLTFTSAEVAANSPVWLVLPTIADVALSGLRVSIGGEPS